jgi:allantoicase
VTADKDFGITKYHRMAPVVNEYAAEAGAKTGISVFRATKKYGMERGKVWDIRLMERHPFTSQAFIPMSKGEVSRLCAHRAVLTLSVEG